MGAIKSSYRTFRGWAVAHIFLSAVLAVTLFILIVFVSPFFIIFPATLLYFVSSLADFTADWAHILALVATIDIAISIVVWIVNIVLIYRFPNPFGWIDLGSDKTNWGTLTIFFSIVGVIGFLAKLPKYVNREEQIAASQQPAYSPRRDGVPAPTRATAEILGCARYDGTSVNVLQSGGKWLVYECADCKSVHKTSVA